MDVRLIYRYPSLINVPKGKGSNINRGRGRGIESRVKGRRDVVESWK